MKALLTAVFLSLGQVSIGQYVHSHNDYKQSVPFFDALKANAYSIEVDVWGVEDKLYVAHDRVDIRPENTLESLYLESLYTLDVTTQVQLLIDVKTDAFSTLDLIVKKLQDHPFLTQGGQIKFVISGNRPPVKYYHSYPDFITFDYQDLSSLKEAPLKKVEMLSLPFYKLSGWDGESLMSEEDRAKLTYAIKTAHDLGLPIRFWATPDTPLAWRAMQNLQVDFINTDKPSSCSLVLNSYK